MYVVFADLHGHVQKMEKIIRYCERKHLSLGRRMVFLGDYFDRGPDVKGLVGRLIRLQSLGHICLAGNHEYTLRQALFQEDEALRLHWISRWLRITEHNSLASYGISRRKPIISPADGVELAEKFKAAMPEHHRQFLQELPLYYEDERYIFVHAGLDRELSWEQQRADLIADLPHEQGPNQLFSSQFAKDPCSSWKLHKCLVTGHSDVIMPRITSDRVQLCCGVDCGGQATAWISGTGRCICA